MEKILSHPFIVYAFMNFSNKSKKNKILRLFSMVFFCLETYFSLVRSMVLKISVFAEKSVVFIDHFVRMTLKSVAFDESQLENEKIEILLKLVDLCSLNSAKTIIHAFFNHLKTNKNKNLVRKQRISPNFWCFFG